MTGREMIEEMYRHMEWADAAIWRSVLGSPAASADETLLAQLQHLHLVQRGFLRLWQGDIAGPPDLPAAGARALVDWARIYYPQARATIAAASDEAFDQPLELPWAAQLAELGSAPAPLRLIESMIQVYAHTAHHRGQLAAGLRGAGVDPPQVDFIAWALRGKPVAVWP